LHRSTIATDINRFVGHRQPFSVCNRKGSKRRGRVINWATDHRQEADQECAFIHAGQIIKIHDLDAEFRVMTPRRVGNREGLESSPQQPLGGPLRLQALVHRGAKSAAGLTKRCQLIDLQEAV
jgi:hypothetical protein